MPPIFRNFGFQRAHTLARTRRIEETRILRFVATTTNTELKHASSLQRAHAVIKITIVLSCSCLGSVVGYTACQPVYI